MEVLTGVTFVDDIPPVLTCPTKLLNNLGDLVDDPTYRLHRRIAGPTDSAVAVSWASATVTDNHGVSNVLVTYDPERGVNLTQGTHMVTATATDMAGNVAQCSFQAKVWKPYPAFKPSNVVVSVQSMVIRDPIPQVYYADILYITKVEWPYVIITPNRSDLPPGVMALYEVVNSRSCSYLGDHFGLYESLRAYCYQYWKISVSLDNCDAVEFTLNLAHVADCAPRDCLYDRSPSTIVLSVSSGNLCETDLGTANANAKLFVVTDVDFEFWNLTDKSFDPVYTTGFEAGSPVNAVVRVSSTEVKIQSVAIHSAVRRTYADETLSGQPVSSATLIAQFAVLAGDYYVDPNFVSGRNYATFKYNETNLREDVRIYVKLTVTVLIQYDLGQQGSGRRLLDIDIFPDTSLRNRRSILQNAGEADLEASTGLYIQGVQNNGDKNGGTRPPVVAQEKAGWWHTWWGIFVAVLLAIFCTCCICITIAKASFRHGMAISRKETEKRETFRKWAYQLYVVNWAKSQLTTNPRSSAVAAPDPTNLSANELPVVKVERLSGNEKGKKPEKSPGNKGERCWRANMRKEVGVQVDEQLSPTASEFRSPGGSKQRFNAASPKSWLSAEQNKHLEMHFGFSLATPITAPPPEQQQQQQQQPSQPPLSPSMPGLKLNARARQQVQQLETQLGITLVPLPQLPPTSTTQPASYRAQSPLTSPANRIQQQASAKAFSSSSSSFSRNNTTKPKGPSSSRKRGPSGHSGHSRPHNAPGSAKAREGHGMQMHSKEHKRQKQAGLASPPGRSTGLSAQHRQQAGQGKKSHRRSHSHPPLVEGMPPAQPAAQPEEAVSTKRAASFRYSDPRASLIDVEDESQSLIEIDSNNNNNNNQGESLIEDVPPPLHREESLIEDDVPPQLHRENSLIEDDEGPRESLIEVEEVYPRESLIEVEEGFKLLYNSPYHIV
eukprot:g7951.t1